MAQSYIELRKNAPAIIGCICSRCNNPIITFATITTHAVQHYSFLQTRAQEIAEEEADKAISF